MSHTPDHIHNPTYPCSCTIAHLGRSESISYCAKHAAAPELLAALEAVLPYLEHPDVQAINFCLSSKTVARKLRATIARAKGE